MPAKRNTSTCNLICTPIFTICSPYTEERRKRQDQVKKGPLEVIEAVERHHGAHALARGREGALQKEFAALSPHFKPA